MDETNIIVSSFAKSLGVEKVITKVSNGNYDKILNQIGLDTIIAPKEIFANAIIRYVRGMQSNRSSEFKTLYRLVNNKVEALEFIAKEDKDLINIPLKDLKLKENTLIAAIIRDGRVIYPSGMDVIEPNDSVIIVTTNQFLDDLNDILE
jgi:trk system potassium uptake protein TrkA